jgi:hypothetical protein
VSGTLRPITLAALRLMTKSYLVGFCTGRSAGFSPLRIRSVYSATRLRALILVEKPPRERPSALRSGPLFRRPRNDAPG